VSRSENFWQSAGGFFSNFLRVFLFIPSNYFGADKFSSQRDLNYARDLNYPRDLNYARDLNHAEISERRQNYLCEDLILTPKSKLSREYIRRRKMYARESYTRRDNFSAKNIYAKI